jgi:hypothetical protein
LHTREYLHYNTTTKPGKKQVIYVNLSIFPVVRVGSEANFELRLYQFKVFTPIKPLALADSYGCHTTHNHHIRTDISVS